MLGNVADAEDAVQDAYVRAYRSLTSGRFDRRSSFETWLYRVAVNSSIDLMRARKRRPAATDATSDIAYDGQSSAEARVALAELDDLLAALPDEQRAALVLTAMEGLSAKEAAALLEVSEGAVEQRLVRARATLRERSRSDD
jgi:RNA polymerase sigma-70 factor (ECF subfamily)